jgi:hypothetical protein
MVSPGAFAAVSDRVRVKRRQSIGAHAVIVGAYSPEQSVSAFSLPPPHSFSIVMHTPLRLLAALPLLFGALACHSSPEGPAEVFTQPTSPGSHADTVAPQLERLGALIGTWELTEVSLAEDGSSTSVARGPSYTRSTLNGFLLETELRVDVGGGTITDCLFQWSFDPFMKVYRITITEGAFGYMDVYEGVFDERGRLLFTNEGMATPLTSPDGTFAARYQLEFHGGADAPSYTLAGCYSMDGGDTWSDGLELRFE